MKKQRFLCNLFYLLRVHMYASMDLWIYSIYASSPAFDNLPLRIGICSGSFVSLLPSWIAESKPSSVVLILVACNICPPSKLPPDPPILLLNGADKPSSASFSLSTFSTSIRSVGIATGFNKRHCCWIRYLWYKNKKNQITIYDI